MSTDQPSPSYPLVTVRFTGGPRDGETLCGKTQTPVVPARWFFVAGVRFHADIGSETAIIFNALFSKRIPPAMVDQTATAENWPAENTAAYKMNCQYRIAGHEVQPDGSIVCRALYRPIGV